MLGTYTRIRLNSIPCRSFGLHWVGLVFNCKMLLNRDKGDVDETGVAWANIMLELADRL